MARRRVSVSAFRDVSSGLILEYDGRRVTAAAGRAISRGLKLSLRRGSEPDGDALPRPRDGGRPMYRTGDLVKSIGVTVRKQGGQWRAVVWPKRQRRESPRKADQLGASLRGRNAGLLAVLIYGRRSWRGERPRMDPMIYVARWNADVEDAVERELARQLARGSARLRTSVLGRATTGTVSRGLVRRLLGRG